MESSTVKEERKEQSAIKKKYYCEECGQEISKEDFVLYEGKCFECRTIEEDEDLFLGS